MGFLDSVSAGLKYAPLTVGRLRHASLSGAACASSAAAATQKGATKVKLKTEISLLEGRAWSDSRLGAYTREASGTH